MPISKELAHLRGVIAGLSRDRSHDDPELVEAKLKLREVRLREYIEENTRQAPPLRTEQLDRLAQLLRGGPDAA